tara:strand:- start:593 stop:1222 length:630 start_codon:yes stop_codon:yes gene_type:complete
MIKVIVATLIAITACGIQAKHRPLQIGLETGLETGFQDNKMTSSQYQGVIRKGSYTYRYYTSQQNNARFSGKYKNMIIGAKVGYEVQINDSFSVTPITHFGTSLDNNKIKTELELEYYVEFGTKFSVYNNAKQRIFFYVEPNYRYQQMNLTSDKTKTNGYVSFKNEGMGVKLGVGGFITDNMMIDFSVSKHLMENKEASHTLLGISYAL